MTYDELTIELSEENSHALLLCPRHIGGDSTDIKTFIEDVWQEPVTDENHKNVAREFRKWYKEVAPDEYFDPVPPVPTSIVQKLIRTGMVGRQPIGKEPGKKRSLHATDADWEWLGAFGDGSQAEGLRRLRRLHND